ncbi:MAG: hypothetical protein AB7O71_04955 [Hyphomicrobiaceae bacterium]|jgi:hypothetical protein
MQTAYIVVPFERVGTRVGARQAMMVDAVNKARHLAQNLARQVPGVAVLERTEDPETGDDVDILLEGYGILPPAFPDGINWTVALN